MQRIGFLSHRGFVLAHKTLILGLKSIGSTLAEFKKDLTFVHRPKIGRPISVKMFNELLHNNTRYWILPRGLISDLLKAGVINVINVVLEPLITKDHLSFTGKLYPNQKLIVDRLCEIATPERLANGTAVGILNLRAGMGKTFVAAGFISKIKLRTLYIVFKRPLLTQAVDDLRGCFYNIDQDQTDPIIIEPFNKKKSCNDHFVTVIVINSALKRSKEFFAGYQCVILDEIHTYCSTTRREIFKLATAHVMIGMSATTEDRNDGFDIIAHKELAPDGIIRAEEIPGFTYDEIEFNINVREIRYNGLPEYTEALTHESTGRIFVPYMIMQMLDDIQRMELAIKELQTLYDWVGPNGEKHYIYVFCEERDPLQYLFDLLCKLFNVEAPELKDVGKFIGGIKDTEVIKLKENARILLSTYGYAGTGVSIDKMTAILFLTPRRSQMKQIIPRILRRGGNTNVPRVIVDIVDNKTPMRYQWVSRAAAYEYYGAKIKTIYIDAKENVQCERTFD
jgi:superfamily II DNA or RNA helicase